MQSRYLPEDESTVAMIVREADQRTFAARVEGLAVQQIWQPRYDHVRGGWYVADDTGCKLRHGRRRAFVTKYKTCAGAQARADRLNASFAAMESMK